MSLLLTMWWYVVAAWLLAAAALGRGGVPPQPLHVGGYQRRLVYDGAGAQQAGHRQDGGAAALEELFRDVAGPVAAEDWGPEIKRSGEVASAQALASQHMLRSPRGSRQYDVPQIGE